MKSGNRKCIGAPMLTVTRLGNGVTVSWPFTTGFELEQNSDLSTTNWTVSTYAVSTNGVVESITITPPVGICFSGSPGLKSRPPKCVGT